MPKLTDSSKDISSVWNDFCKKRAAPWQRTYNTVHFRYEDWKHSPNLPLSLAEDCISSLGINPAFCMKRYFSVQQLDTVLKCGTDRDTSSWLNHGDEELFKKSSCLKKEFLTYAGNLTKAGARWVNQNDALAIWDMQSLIRVPNSSYSLYAFRKGAAKKSLIAVISIHGDTPMPS